MQRLREHSLRCAAAFFFVALTVVPLAASGHYHTTTEAAQNPCAVCAVALHAPTVAPPLLPRITPILHSFAVAAAASGAPVQIFRPFTAGRAPPLSSLSA